MSGSKTLLAERERHLVGERAGDNHAVGLARRGAEDDAEAIEVVAGGAGVHHLHGAASEPERHGPDGAPPRQNSLLLEPIGFW